MNHRNYFNILNNLKNRPDISCACDTCKSMCRLPCLGTPREMKKIIEKGYKNRLKLKALDYFDDEDWQTVFVLCPVKNTESLVCTFQCKDGLCELHDSKLKPIEGRKADCSKIEEHDGIQLQIALLWEKPFAKKLIKSWCQSTGTNDPYLCESPSEYLYQQSMKGLQRFMNSATTQTIKDLANESFL